MGAGPASCSNRSTGARRVAEAAAWADQQGFVHISDALADLIALGLKQDKLPSTYMPGVTMRANGQSELPLREAMHLKAS